MPEGRCDWCGRRLDRPGFEGQCAGRHPAPDDAERLAELVEGEICTRKGLDWRGLDEEVLDDIRDGLVSVIRDFLRRGKDA